MDLYRVFVGSLPQNDQLASDPAQLLPQLLDRLIELADMARQLSLAIGGNGYRAEAARELIKELTR